MKLDETTIFLDAHFDLSQAGMRAPEGMDPDDYVVDFRRTYEGLADIVGEELGVEITVTSPPCSDYGGIDGHVESTEWARKCELWQLLHDHIFWEEDDQEFYFYKDDVDAIVNRVRFLMS